MPKQVLKLLLSCAGIAAISLWLANIMLNSERAVEIRNAMLASVGESADFSWSPAQRPADFKQERLPSPERFLKISQQAVADLPAAASQLDRALALAAHLLRSPGKRGQPVQSTTERAYEVIASSGRGYCADYTQVFNALALAAGIDVREWGLSFEGFGAGHAFNEIYDPSAEKWIMIDTFNAFYLRRAAGGEPLSVLEFNALLRDDNAIDAVDIVEIVPGKLGFRDRSTLIEYYRRGADQFYLWWGNNVHSYDASIATRWFGPVSRSAEQAVAIATGMHPKIRILPNASQAAIAEMKRSRLALAGSGMALLILFVLVIRQSRAIFAAGRNRPLATTHER